MGALLDEKSVIFFRKKLFLKLNYQDEGEQYASFLFYILIV